MSAEGDRNVLFILPARSVRSASAPSAESGASARKEARRGKTRRRQRWRSAMALGPGLVRAEVVGSVFCPLTLSRRLHCLLQRTSRPITLAGACRGPRARGHSSTVADTSPRDALRGKRHAVTFPCARGASRYRLSRRGTLAVATIASDANHCVAGNVSGGVRSAGPRRSTDSWTVGDTSPRDTFPASSSWSRQ